MTYSIFTLLATIAIILAMALTLILKPNALRKFNGAAVFFAGIVGLIFYGLGYGSGIQSPREMFIMSIKAVDDTIAMFAGKDSFSSLMSSAAWFAENAWMQVLYWIAVLAAMYFTAAVVLGALGKRFLRFLRSCIIGWRNDIVVFYPVSQEQIDIATSISKKNHINPVFIGECSSDKEQEKIDEIGGVILEEDIVKEDGEWIEKLGLTKDSKKIIKLFASGETDAKTKKFLQKVLKGMEKKRIPTKSITMTVLCNDEHEFGFLTEKQKDGYYLQADLCAYRNMAAKVMTKTVAPWDFITFSENGEALNGFHAMILGFGQMGQSVLCELIRNSQFAGQKTKIQIVDKNYKEKAGAFLSIYKEMLEYYEIEFLVMDAFSEEFFQHLHDSRQSLNYICLCLGDDAKNQETAAQIRFFRNRKTGDYQKDMVIASCSKKEVVFYDSPDLTLTVPDTQSLWAGTLDEEAKEIHKVYVKNKALSLYPNNLDKQHDFYDATWYENDYSSRLSCDASATFIPALYKAAGIGKDEKNPKAAMTKILKENSVLLENLSEMEHERWNAFSYSMGVKGMKIEELNRRVEKAIEDSKEDMAYLESDTKTLEESKAALGRIQNACKYVRKELEADGFGGVHVCLTDWDSLDFAWENYLPVANLLAKAEYEYAILQWKENDEKGEKPQMQTLTDFKQLDTNNIMNLMEEIL